LTVHIDFGDIPIDITSQIYLDSANITKIRNHKITPWLIANLNYLSNLRYLKGYIILAFLCLSPRKYGLTDSFEYPFIKEYKKFAASIPNIRNSFDDSIFTLRFWLILYSGDNPARSDTIGIIKPGNAKTLYT
jgi:hypothetical protein